MTSVDRSKGLQIDSQKFVRERSTLAGELAVSRLVRLAESLADNVGTLRYELQARENAPGHAGVLLEVKGKIRLQCQRCLGGFVHELDIATPLRLVAPERLEQEQDDDPDEPDVIAHSRTLDVQALIEDEVLLALPAHPRHAQGGCAARAADVGSAPQAQETGSKVLAFSALRTLKQKDNQSKE